MELANWRGKIFVLLFLIFILVLTGCVTTSQEQIKSVETGVAAEESASLPTSTTVETGEEVTVNDDTKNSNSPKGIGNSQSSSAIENNKVEAPEKVITEGELTIHYIDVGQGGSQLIIGPTGKTILIDAGNNNKEKTVVGYLKDQDITKIDFLIGTHPDADHTGGLDKVIDNFDIGKIYMPRVQSNTKTFESVLLAIQNKGLKVTTAKSGLILDWEPGIVVKMIAPVNTYDDANEMSAVIHLTHGQTAFLFTGDAEAKSESDMLASGVSLKADVLLAGHHGSKSSTSQAFLDEVNPKYAVIQSGKDNNYGHPTQEVLKRLNDKKVEIYRNDEQGNIVFTSNGKDISVAQNHWKYTAVATNNEASFPPQEQSKESAKEELVVSASIDDASPKQNSTIVVTVKVQDGSGKPVNGAEVVLTLHYKSTETVYEGKTNAAGVSTLSFKIGRAAKDFTVDGDITVTYGDKTSNVSVSFTPK